MQSCSAPVECGTCLAVFERIELREGGRTVNLVVGRVPRHAACRFDAEHVPAIAVRHREVLPDGEADAVDRSLEQPLARSRRVRCLHDYIRHLVGLQTTHTHTGTRTVTSRQTVNCKHSQQTRVWPPDRRPPVSVLPPTPASLSVSVLWCGQMGA